MRTAVRPPTLRGVAWVCVHAAAFVVATLFGFGGGERARPLQTVVLMPAAVAGRRVHWPAHRWANRVRRRLGTAAPFRAATRLLLDDALDPLDGAGYVGTVPDRPGDADTLARVERRLTARGFRRNPTAYLTYRERYPGDRTGTDVPGRECERGSWALRERADARRQLHVLLYDAPDGVDVYGHWEPSVLAGAAHYGRPDYATGVAMTERALAETGLRVDPRRRAGGDGRPGRRAEAVSRVPFDPGLPDPDPPGPGDDPGR